MKNILTLILVLIFGLGISQELFIYKLVRSQRSVECVNSSKQSVIEEHIKGISRKDIKRFNDTLNKRYSYNFIDQGECVYFTIVGYQRDMLYQGLINSDTIYIHDNLIHIWEGGYLRDARESYLGQSDYFTYKFVVGDIPEFDFDSYVYDYRTDQALLYRYRDILIDISMNLDKDPKTWRAYKFVQTRFSTSHRL
jgi:hypothetical protein